MDGSSCVEGRIRGRGLSWQHCISYLTSFLCLDPQMPVAVGPYGQTQPSCFDRVKMGFMMGFAVGMAAGAMLGTFSCLRYGPIMVQHRAKVRPTQNQRTVKNGGLNLTLWFFLFLFPSSSFIWESVISKSGIGSFVLTLKTFKTFYLQDRHARQRTDGGSWENHDAERGHVRYFHGHRHGHPLLKNKLPSCSCRQMGLSKATASMLAHHLPTGWFCQ